MDRTQLLQNFDTLAETPEAVAKVRETILQLGLSGRLVAQDPRDTSAECIVSGGGARKPQQKPEQEALSVSYKSSLGRMKLPVGWVLVTLDQVASMSVGKTPSTKQYNYWDRGSIPWVSIGDMEPWGIVTSTGRRVTKLAQDDVFLSSPVSAGTLLMSFKLTIGKVATLGVDAFHNEAIVSVKPIDGVEQSYLFRFLPVLARAGVSKGAIKGATLNKQSVAAIPIPLPPTAEQKRIVAKVEELLALCDELEARQAVAREHRTRLVRSALGHLTDANGARVCDPQHVARKTECEKRADISLPSERCGSQSPAPQNDFHRHAAFVLREFPQLTAAPEDVPALRQAILSLAVQGKLVPQNPKDEPSAHILNRLEKDRRSYTEENGFRMPPDSNVEEKPFSLPQSWQWARLSSLFNAVTDGDHIPPPKSNDGVAFLTIGNITTGKLDFTGCRFVPDSYFDALASFRRPSRGDILYTVVGATYGRPALVESDRPFCVQRHIAILKPAASMEVRYLLSVLRSPLVYEQATASTTGTAQPTIPLGSLRNILIPVPPLAEQQRIVAKVDGLMRWCGALEARLAAAQTTATHLLDATLRRILLRTFKGEL